MKHRLRVYVSIILLINIVGLFHYIFFLKNEGYLPSPFLYAKDDTFMDFFNVLQWAYNDGRYTEWNSVYPPLNFFIARLINFTFGGDFAFGSAGVFRENSITVILGLCLIYCLIPAIMLGTRIWREFGFFDKILIYFAILFSTPMLFTLERGNIIILVPFFLSLALSRSDNIRLIIIALLINIKPYFALLLIFYIARKKWGGFLYCIFITGVIFLITGLSLDDQFLNFFKNLFLVTKDKDSYSLRELMTLPSSISAFSFILMRSEGVDLVANFINPESLISVIEVAKWSVLALSLFSIFAKSRLLLDAEIFSLLTIVITNLGVSVGGYTLIFYYALIPVFLQMRAKWLYLSLISVMAIPLDMFDILGGSIGEQYSYLSDTQIEVFWSLGLGSLMRPIANFLFVLLISFEVLGRTHKATRSNLPDSARWVRNRAIFQSR